MTATLNCSPANKEAGTLGRDLLLSCRYWHPCPFEQRLGKVVSRLPVNWQAG